jgi:hypothetical protein
MKLTVKELKLLIRESIEQELGENSIDFGDGAQDFDSQMPERQPEENTYVIAAQRLDVVKTELAKLDSRIASPHSLKLINNALANLEKLVGIHSQYFQST